MAPAPRPLNILLAEDNSVNQRVACAMLAKRGHHVTVVDDGRQAVDAAINGTFDLVLMDVQMPEMSGFEATAAIRSRERGTGCRLPIVAMTAHAMSGDRERCLEAGMDGYLSKPVQLDELAAVLDATDAQRGAEPVDLLDPQSLELLRALSTASGESLLGLSIQSYLMTSADDLSAVRRLAEEGRWPEVGRTVHRLKGSSATLGATRVAAVCAAIEERARGPQGEDLGILIARLGRELERTQAALRQLAVAAPE